MVRIILVRHGESLANVGRAAGSFSGCPLTEEGERQAENLAGLWSQAPDLIIRSPFHRTIQTSLPTIARFPHVPVDEWSIHEFINLETSRWDGTLPSARASHVARFWDNCDADYCDGPNAESFAAFFRRMREALERMQSLPDGTLAYVFSHGFAMHMIRMQILHPHLREPELMRRFVDEWNHAPILNTDRIEITWQGDRWSIAQSAESSQDDAASSVLAAGR